MDVNRLIGIDVLVFGGFVLGISIFKGVRIFLKMKLILV